MNYKGGLILLSIALSFVVLQPVLAKGDCSAITIDNDTSDWEALDPILSDDQDITGTTYYYNGAAWSTTASDHDLYSTNISSMQDLETVKVCNSATQLQLYIDSYHPLLSYLDMASGNYYEFGDPSGPDGELGLPANLDFWLVFKLQEVDSTEIYYYVIYFYAEAGALGLENGPRQTAIYKESDSADFTTATFNPNEDELTVEIEAETSSKDNKILAGKEDGGKTIDTSGGLETDVALMNSDGTGLFNLTDILYGDTLNFSVETYTGSAFTNSKAIIATSSETNDQTDVTAYRVKRKGVTGVMIPKNQREANQAVVEWDELTEATIYQIRLVAKRGKVLATETTENTSVTLADLQSNHRYFVQVRASIGELYTAWSTKKPFKTKE